MPSGIQRGTGEKVLSDRGPVTSCFRPSSRGCPAKPAGNGGALPSRCVSEFFSKQGTRPRGTEPWARATRRASVAEHLRVRPFLPRNRQRAPAEIRARFSSCAPPSAPRNQDEQTVMHPSRSVHAAPDNFGAVFSLGRDFNRRTAVPAWERRRVPVQERDPAGKSDILWQVVARRMITRTPRVVQNLCSRSGACSAPHRPPVRPLHARFAVPNP